MPNDSKSKLSVLRFPRLSTENASARRLFRSVAVATYNALSRKKSIAKQRIHYDVLRTRNGPKIRVDFTLLAHKLMQRHIDPSVYIKVLSQYGYYGRAPVMPNPAWLCSEKAFEVYGWLYPREKNKYDFKEDFTGAHRVGAAGFEGVIREQIREGWRYLEANRYGMSLDLAVLTNAYVLPDWFLVASPEFLRSGALELLSVDRKERLLKKLRIMAKSRAVRRLALREYRRAAR